VNRIEHPPEKMDAEAFTAVHSEVFFTVSGSDGKEVGGRKNKQREQKPCMCSRIVAAV
jgi:hypothetical protein